MFPYLLTHVTYLVYFLFLFRFPLFVVVRVPVSVSVYFHSSFFSFTSYLCFRLLSYFCCCRFGFHFRRFCLFVHISTQNSSIVHVILVYSSLSHFSSLLIVFSTLQFIFLFSILFLFKSHIYQSCFLASHLFFLHVSHFLVKSILVSGSLLSFCFGSDLNSHPLYFLYSYLLICFLLFSLSFIVLVLGFSSFRFCPSSNLSSKPVFHISLILIYFALTSFSSA